MVMSCMETSVPRYGRLWKLKNREKEERLTKEIVGRLLKERFGTIWLEKRGFVQLKEMARAMVNGNC